MHDPVFAAPTQYGTAYHAYVNAVLAAHGPEEQRAEYADRALRGVDAALRHTENPQLPPTGSGFDRDTGSILSAGNHRDFTWPPILKAYRILRDLGADRIADLGRRIAAVDIEASFRSRPPSNWSSVWLSGEWIRVQEGLSPNSTDAVDSWINGFFERIDLELGWYEEPGRPNSYDLFTRFHLLDLLAEGYAGAQADRLRTLLHSGLRRSLNVQMSDGSLPSAHRSAGQSWTDGVQIAYFTHAADLIGDTELADRARSAGRRAFGSLARWQRPGGPFSPVQNLLPPTARVGYEGYTADAHYSNLALGFLANAIHCGFEAGPIEPERAPSYRVEQEPISRAVVHSGRTSVQVNAAPAPAYDGFGITDITFGPDRRLHFSSSVKSSFTGSFVNVGLGVRRNGPGRSKLVPLAGREHAVEGDIESSGSRVLVRSAVADSGLDEWPSLDYQLQVDIVPDGVDVVESTPGLNSPKSVLVPYLRDAGAGVTTVVEEAADGAVLVHGGERIRITVDGPIEAVLDLPTGYENRRGLCGLLRIDLAGRTQSVRYRIRGY
ncbi:MAG TPA: hypothetical protein VHC49_12005 [Mycobacteriales bacterium]|nr:hypothetical protein [Mycobacteriales bacterium]